jgi:superfamily II DNA helicase RecQ
MGRRDYEKMIGVLARQRHVREEADSFERDGRVIEFRRLFPTNDNADLETIRIPVEPVAPKAAIRVEKYPEPATSDAPPELVETLRQWRLEQARRRGVPAFCIFSNKTMLALAAAGPTNEEMLLRVRGIGPKLAREYGNALLRVIAGTGTDDERETGDTP